MVKRKINDFFKSDKQDVENKNVSGSKRKKRKMDLETELKNAVKDQKKVVKVEKKAVKVDKKAVKVEEVAETEPTRRSGRNLRSRNSVDYKEHLLEAPSPEKPKTYPSIKYKGAVKYVHEMADIAAACDELLQWVKKQEQDVEKIPIAFDMEWPFSFQTGPGRSAVIQMCADEKLCYVLHISELKKLPAVLLELLEHPKVCLHGVNIKNDFRKLQRDFPEANADHLISQCVDLGPWCNAVCNTGGRWSLERLVKYICNLQIDKNKLVRMSKWHIIPLTDPQRIYAAIDVYISQVIYRELEAREIRKAAEKEKFLQEHGEKALQAVTALGENFL